MIAIAVAEKGLREEAILHLGIKHSSDGQTLKVSNAKHADTFWVMTNAHLAELQASKHISVAVQSAIPIGIHGTMNWQEA